MRNYRRLAIILDKLQAIDPQGADLPTSLDELEEEHSQYRYTFFNIGTSDFEQNMKTNGNKCPVCGQIILCTETTREHPFKMTTRVWHYCQCYHRLRLQNAISACSIQLEEELADAAKWAGISERYKGASFNNYEVRPGTEELYNTCKQWSYGETGLLLMGGFGCGKTHLANAIANKMIREGHTVKFRTVPKLLSDIKDTYSKERDYSEADLIESLIKTDLLILDDFGTEKATEWVVERLYLLIDGRYQNLKPTIFTTNLTLEQLEGRMGSDQGKIIDRMLETCVIVDCKAPSYREIVKAPAVANKYKQTAN